MPRPIGQPGRMRSQSPSQCTPFNTDRTGFNSNSTRDNCLIRYGLPSYSHNMTSAHTTRPPLRTWLITGATSGIGLELTRQALDAGEAVAALARHTGPLLEFDGNPKLLAIATDVREASSVHAAVNDAVARFGRIDVVANNAGYGLFGAVEESSDAQARAIFDTNVFGALNVLRAVLPVLRAQRSGYIFQGSSLYGQSAHPGVGHSSRRPSMPWKACPMPWPARLHRSESTRNQSDARAARSHRDEIPRQSRLRRHPERLRPDGSGSPHNHLRTSTASILRSGTDRRGHPHGAGKLPSSTAFGIGRGKRCRHACGVECPAGRSGRLVERDRRRRLGAVGSKDGSVSFLSVGGRKHLELRPITIDRTITRES
jgi:short subunit dehydrogenase